jgi:glutamyl-tRNA reductase
MSLLLVGVSHWTAPVSMLDRIATGAQSVTDLRDDIASSPFVAEVMIVSTCNRIEIVADVARFHGAVNDIAGRLAKHSGVPLDELTGHLYVHFEERAVHHLMSVSSGLDSMIVGEQQILGQVRRALSDAQEAGTAGRALNDLGQRSLRVGKKIHTETGIDRHGASVVTVALEETARILGTLVGRKALVVGAGAMSSLALKTLASQGVEDLVVASRTPESTSRAAALVGARTIPMAMVPAELKEVDIAVSATRASGLVITCDDVIEAMV